MADEPVNDTPPASPESPAAPAAPAPAPAPDEKYEALRDQVKQLTDVVQATLTRPTQMPQGQASGPAGHLTDQERAFLRQRGVDESFLNDAAVATALKAFGQLEVAKVAPEVVGLVNTNRDEVAILRAERDQKNYPDWSTTIDKTKGLTIGDKVQELRQNALQNGQALSVRQAYEAAVALNVDAVVNARETQRRSSVAHDATVQGSLGRNAGSVRGGQSGTVSREQLRNMSRDERKAFFDKYGDTPIQ